MTSAPLKHARNPARMTARNVLVIASPVVIVALGTLAARIFILLFGQWAWAPTGIIYWGSMVAMITVFSGRQKVASWFGKSRGSIFWPLLAVLIGLSAFPMLLLPNLSVLRTPLLIAAWIAYGLVNGPIEETYWRGFLFNEICGWPRWLAVTYSSVLFVAIHFLMLGSFSAILFNIPFLIILTIITLAYAMIYLRTDSLRWPVISHVLTDWGNLNIFVFMNMLKPF